MALSYDGQVQGHKKEAWPTQSGTEAQGEEQAGCRRGKKDSLCSFGSEIQEEPRRAKRVGFLLDRFQDRRERHLKVSEQRRYIYVEVTGPQGGIQSNPVVGQLGVRRLSKLAPHLSLPLLLPFTLRFLEVLSLSGLH